MRRKAHCVHLLQSGDAARDLALLEAGPYRADRCRAFDLFPRTGHVETVVLMSESCALDRDVGK